MSVYGGPEISNDGLVLCLDGKNIKSKRPDNNLLDASTWVSDTSGNQPGFPVNGSESENYIISGTDPFGSTANLWEARPDGNDGPDGGWNSDSFPIDHTKMYRFSTWVNRIVLGTNGRFYLGLRGLNSSDTNIGVLNRSNGSNDTNPYFEISSDPPNSNELPVNEWVLVVSYVWPSGSGAGNIYPDTGTYTTTGIKLPGRVNNNYIWNSTNTRALHRTYLFYTEETSPRQRWAYPRVDVMDGTEPSINDLINNRVNSLYLYDVSNSDNNGVLIDGVSFSNDAINFDGTNDRIIIPFNASTMDFSSGQTIGIWMKPATGSNSARRNPYNQAYGGPGTLTYETNRTINYYFGTNGGNGQPYVGRNSGFTVAAEELAFITVTRDQGSNITKWYKNGELITTANAGGYATTNNGSSPILIGDGYTSNFLGNIYSVAVYNRALSETEVKRNFNALRGRFGI